MTTVRSSLSARGCRLARVVALAACLGVPAIAGAQSLDEIQFKVATTTPDAFRAEADRIRTSLGEGGRHVDLGKREKQRVGTLLDAMQALFDARGNGEAFNETDRIAAMNAQQEINAILARDPGARIVCEFVTQTGSHRKTKVCMSVADKEAMRRNDQRALGDETRAGAFGGRQ